MKRELERAVNAGNGVEVVRLINSYKLRSDALKPQLSAIFTRVFVRYTKENKAVFSELIKEFSHFAPSRVQDFYLCSINLAGFFRTPPDQLDQQFVDFVWNHYTHTARDGWAVKRIQAEQLEYNTVRARYLAEKAKVEAQVEAEYVAAEAAEAAEVARVAGLERVTEEAAVAAAEGAVAISLEENSVFANLQAQAHTQAVAASQAQAARLIAAAQAAEAVEMANLGVEAVVAAGTIVQEQVDAFASLETQMAASLEAAGAAEVARVARVAEVARATEEAARSVVDSRAPLGEMNGTAHAAASVAHAEVSQARTELSILKIPTINNITEYAEAVVTIITQKAPDMMKTVEREWGSKIIMKPSLALCMILDYYDRACFSAVVDRINNSSSVESYTVDEFFKSYIESLTIHDFTDRYVLGGSRQKGESNVLEIAAVLNKQTIAIDILSIGKTKGWEVASILKDIVKFTNVKVAQICVRHGIKIDVKEFSYLIASIDQSMKKLSQQDCDRDKYTKRCEKLFSIADVFLEKGLVNFPKTGKDASCTKQIHLLNNEIVSLDTERVYSRITSKIFGMSVLEDINDVQSLLSHTSFRTEETAVSCKTDLSIAVDEGYGSELIGSHQDC